jgi:hypothetical protein
MRGRFTDQGVLFSYIAQSAITGERRKLKEDQRVWICVNTSKQTGC